MGGQEHASENSVCVVCERECRPRRCQACKEVIYCSVACQKVHWKAGHKQACMGKRSRASPPVTREQADATLQNLFISTQHMSLHQAQENFHRLSDKIEILEKEARLPKQQPQKQPRGLITTPNTQQKSTPISVLEDQSEDLQIHPEDSVLKSEANIEKNFTVVAEDMEHLRRLQILLSVDPESSDDIPEPLQLALEEVSPSITRLQIQSTTLGRALLSLHIPRRFDQEKSTMQVDRLSRTVLIRLPYIEDPTTADLVCPSREPTSADLNKLACRYCEQPLLASRSLRRVMPLPTGHWEDIADYLICYNGQPVVDFCSSSATASPSVALQDRNIICLHQQDVMNALCVLAVTGYGERDDEEAGSQRLPDLLQDPAATIRGDRQWRDVSGGASVYCSQCCVPLGFAGFDTPQSMRLLKHRLILKDEDDQDATDQRIGSCVSFLAREMVRYAESKAIFTFLVANENVEPSSSAKGKCILLRLLSWDNIMATKLNRDRVSNHLLFERVAKVVYEEVEDKLHSSIARGADDITQWTWGGVDLCCFPTKEETQRALTSGTDPHMDTPMAGDKIPNTAVSSVRLTLPPDEYDEILTNLERGEHCFSQSLVEATISLKMGYYTNSLGLSMIELEK